MRVHRPRPQRADHGSAVVEFVFLGVLLIIPVIYLVMTLARLEAGTFVVSSAAREAGRAFVTSPGEQHAGARAQAAADLAFADQNFAGLGDIALRCDGSPCVRAEGQVEVTATVTVPFPLVPEFFADVLPLEIPVSATHIEIVDRFRGTS